MKPIDTSALHSAIKQTAAAMLSEGETTPGSFVRRFRSDHRDLVAEYTDFLVDQQLADEGRKAIKDIRRAAQTATGSRQLVLPMSMAPLHVPTSLQITRDGAPVWVPTVDAGIEDGRAYLEVLWANVKACQQHYTDFEEFWRQVEPLLKANPGWRVGDALKFLREQASTEDLAKPVLQEAIAEAPGDGLTAEHS